MFFVKVVVDVVVNVWDIINYVILAQGRHQHPLNLPKDLQGPGWSVALDIGQVNRVDFLMNRPTHWFLSYQSGCGLTGFFEKSTRSWGLPPNSTSGSGCLAKAIGLGDR